MSPNLTPPVKMSRVWAMPHGDTFTIKPIAELLDRYLRHGMEIVDPFARNSMYGTVRNDLNPNTSAQYHLKAEEFAVMLRDRTEQYDAIIMDPPYSPRQISECYQSAGLTATMQDTQGAKLYSSVRDALAPTLKPGGLALSFGWNSVGCGVTRGFDLEEILLVCHGGAHNDTICLVERKQQAQDPATFGGLFDLD